jgi:hypothetical protein
MSALPPKAGIWRPRWNVRFGPIAANSPNRKTAQLSASSKPLVLVNKPVSGRAYAGQHPGQPRLMRLPLHREVAVPLFQAFARFKRTFIEQRRSIREHVHFSAWIDIGDGSKLRDCTVLDVSEGGARIILSSPVELPKEFWLVLTKVRSRRRHYRRIWRSDTQVGVSFLGPIQSDFFRPRLN